MNRAFPCIVTAALLAMGSGCRKSSAAPAGSGAVRDAGVGSSSLADAALPELPDASPPSHPIAPIPSDAALLTGRRVIVYERRGEGHGHLSAFDVITGARLWRVEVAAPNPELDRPDVIAFSATHVLLRVGRTLIAYELGSGATSHTYANVVDLSENKNIAGRRSYVARGGACGFGNRCDFQLVDCSDARPVGAPIKGGELHKLIRGSGHQHTVGCGSFRVEPVGRAGDLAVVAVVDNLGALRARAIDVRTGTVKWETTWPELGSVESRSLDGVGTTPDGKSALVSTQGTIVAMSLETGQHESAPASAHLPPDPPMPTAFELRPAGQRAIALWRRSPPTQVATLGDAAETEILGEYVHDGITYVALQDRGYLKVFFAR